MSAMDCAGIVWRSIIGGDSLPNPPTTGCLPGMAQSNQGEVLLLKRVHAQIPILTCGRSLQIALLLYSSPTPQGDVPCECCSEFLFLSMLGMQPQRLGP